METCISFLDAIEVEQTGGTFYKGNVFSLSDGHVTYAPHFYNIALKSPYAFDIQHQRYGKFRPMEFEGKICSRLIFRSNLLLEKLTKTGKLTSINTPTIQDQHLKKCLNEIIEYNNEFDPENKRVQNNQRKQYATSNLVNHNSYCTDHRLATLAATGLINYKGKFDCWHGNNKPLGFEEFTDPPPLVIADAPITADVLDNTEDEFYIELNGKPHRALRSSVNGLPFILVNIAPKTFKLFGGVAPRGVKLLPKGNIIQIKEPANFERWYYYDWITGDIVC
ncbi:hypothetical protein GcM3_068028 [Golovinomyces cichoracearum]|uniref:Uncharacterized protein n=1 Tax=Golovinomyces cichoracearum TaxID=62708 RepID=A0A420ITT3_9PEZI|nr:hypothetical protein GcM3_068028 [Golovinomyces cichoracearum]